MSYGVKKGDFVKVIAGKDKGKTAQVTAVNAETHRVQIEGKDLKTVNIKAVKARKANEKGGLVKQAGSVDISNVLPVCAACGKATRVGYKVLENGEKVRICKKCGEVLVTEKAATKRASKAEAKADTANKKIRKKASAEGTEENK
ncbi:MAG: 50S ribosomal protein L24 [Christensenellaceae bacterium]|jgi:large subunit ribosomal protein L24|nr:50S ribosomal protein L24 [Christensenellaceae bacterium]